MKPVADPEIAGAIDNLSSAIEALVELGLDPVDHRDAHTMVRSVEKLGRNLDSAQITLMTTIDDAELYAVDGFFSAKTMVRHDAKLSAAEAARRAGSVKALRSLPELAAAFADGTVGLCQVQRLARSFANKRIRDKVIAAESELVRLARVRPYDEFHALVTDFRFDVEHLRRVGVAVDVLVGTPPDSSPASSSIVGNRSIRDTGASTVALGPSPGRDSSIGIRMAHSPRSPSISPWSDRTTTAVVSSKPAASIASSSAASLSSK